MIILLSLFYHTHNNYSILTGSLIIYYIYIYIYIYIYTTNIIAIIFMIAQYHAYNKIKLLTLLNNTQNYVMKKKY